MIEITVTITTCNRYLSTLPLCLFSILNQTYRPKKVILVDDNIEKSFYKHDILKHIQTLFKLKKIEFEYYYGESKGQVYAQQKALKYSDTEWIFKIDDDNILENNVIELLVNNIDNNVGALSGLILSKSDIDRKIEYEDSIYNRIEEIYRYFNIQKCGDQDNTIKKVEHIYSNYLFRKSLVETYPLDFSPAGYREDTVTTYEIFRKGFDLLIVPEAKIWNLDEQSGGNKKYDNSNHIKNEKLFLDKLKEWNIHLNLIQKEDGVYEKKSNGSVWLVYNF